jgi:hypothetical protein
MMRRVTRLAPLTGIAREENPRRCAVRLKVLLHHEAAHRVANDHWLGGKAVGNRRDVTHPVVDGTRPAILLIAVAMVAEAQSHSPIALIGKEAQEVLVPTPGRMPGSVNKEQRNRMRCGGTPLVDHFKNGRHSLALFATFPRIYSGAKADPIQIATKPTI